MIFPLAGGVAFLLGDLRFPQVFGLVFDGEVVVGWWWNRGSCVGDSWA
jgi:hypothetical protein